MGWRDLATGSNPGKVGSEGGVIVADESYDGAARITLERAARLAPFAITCGVSGSLVHTRFFESEAQARLQFDAMKVALARIAEVVKSADDAQSDDIPLVGRLCQEFVDEFP